MTRIYNPGPKKNSHEEVPPKVYDTGRRFEVRGVTSTGDHYDVTFMGENPFYEPSRFGETEKGLLEKIRKASERSSKNVRDGIGSKQGVIVVDDSFIVTPLPGVEVVSVRKKELQL